MDEKKRFIADISRALGYSLTEERSSEQCLRVFAAGDDDLILERIRYRTNVEKQALLQILQQSGEQLNLDIHPVPSCNAAANKIVEIIRASSPEFSKTRQVIQHDHPDIINLQLWKRLAGDTVQIHTSYSADLEIREKSIESYIGITAPKWAVAESGTIVQLTGPGQPRSTSLVPSIHIALINIKNLLANLSEVYALLRKEPPEDSFVFISGPSKTADIEAHMVHGAHGPREMHIIAVDENMVQEISFRGSGLFSDS